MPTLRLCNELAIEGGKPVRDDFLILGSPLIGEGEITEVVTTLRSGWLGTGHVRRAGGRP